MIAVGEHNDGSNDTRIFKCCDDTQGVMRSLRQSVMRFKGDMLHFLNRMFLPPDCKVPCHW